MKKKKRELDWSAGLVIVILTIIISCLVAVTATIYTNQSLEEYANSLRQREQLLAISEEKPRPLPGTYEEALARVQESGWPSVAFLQEESEDTANSASWITEASASSYGTVLTSDGWVLFYKDADLNVETLSTTAELWIQGERYGIEDVVEDVFTNFMLVKVEANALSTLPFGASSEMLGGDLLFALQRTNEVLPTSLVNGFEQKEDIILQAEVFRSEWKVLDSLETPAPLLNAAGELVGFGYSEQRAVPLHQIQPFIQTVLRYGEPRYAGLGVYTVSVEHILNIDGDIREQTEYGALVTASSTGRRAVALNSPAAVAGIKAGDVITAIDGALIRGNQTLADIIHDYEPGESAEVSVLRDGEEVELELEFGTREDLVY